MQSDFGSIRSWRCQPDDHRSAGCGQDSPGGLNRVLPHARAQLNVFVNLSPNPRDGTRRMFSICESGVTLRSDFLGVSRSPLRTVVAHAAPAQQIQHTRSRSAPGGSATYRNLGHAFVRIWREEGLRGFWKGNMAAQAMVIPYCALSFGSYETSKRQLQAWLDDTSPPESSLPALESSRLESTGLLRTAGRALKDAAPISAMAGFTSAACSTVLTYPLDLLRTRFAAQRMGRPAYTSLGQAFRSILRAEGPSGLYRGLWPTLLGVMPYMGAQFAAFESLMAMHAQLGPRLTPSDSQDTGGDGWQGVSASGVSGFMAGIFAKTVNMPFDLVRKRIQVMHFCPTAVPAEIAWWNPAQPLANAGTTGGPHQRTCITVQPASLGCSWTLQFSSVTRLPPDFKCPAIPRLLAHGVDILLTRFFSSPIVRAIHARGVHPFVFRISSPPVPFPKNV